MSSSTSTSVSFTEQSSALTANLDVCTPLQMVRLFRASDEELLRERVVPGHAGLADASVLAAVQRARALIEGTLQQDAGAIVVMSGCGTSGRIASYCSRYYGDAAQWRYCIAGGDAALSQPVENAEDDATQGAADLARISEGASRVLLIGISCGMSAPYVAGQLEYALNNALWKFTKPILIGFNPVAMARGDAFRRAAARMQAEGGIIINPVLGAEPITGSTRMKGGTATKVLLDALRYGHTDYVERLRRSIATAYADEAALAALIERCGAALLAGGALHYVCTDDRFGWLGKIDASECPPTFGAAARDVVGHLSGERGDDDDFAGVAAPGDVVVGLCHATHRPSLQCGGDDTLALKLQLNVVSSGAHVLRGKIFGNRMVDLRVANNKLFHRAITIVQTIGAFDEPTATSLLLRSIYGDGPVLGDGSVASHVAAAAKRTRVIPTAVLMGRGLSFADAVAALDRQPILSKAI